MITPRLSSSTLAQQTLEKLSALIQDLSIYETAKQPLRLNESSNLLDLLQGNIDELAHQLEQLQAQSKEQLALVLSRISEGYVAMDREGYLLAVNPVAAELFHKAEGNLIGKKCDEIPEDDMLSTFSQLAQKIILENEPVHFETYSSSLQRWFEVNGFAREDFLEFYFHEISEQKGLNEGFRSVARFPEENPNPLLRIDRTGRINYANPICLELLETYQCSIGDLAPTILRDWALEALQNEGKMIKSMPYQDKVYAFTVVPLPEHGYVNLYGSDITKHIQAEEKLLKSNENLQVVLNNITEAYFVLDEQWRIVDYNSVAEREFLKRPKHDLLGKVFWEEYPAAVGNEYYQQYHKAFTSGQPVHFEALSGLVPIWYEVHAYPRNGKLEIYLHNINERKLVEKERERLLEENQQQKDLLEAVLQQMPAGILIADAKSGNLLMGNSQVGAILQQPVTETNIPLDQVDIMAFHADGRPYQREELPLTRSIRSGEVVRGEEIYYKRKDNIPGVISVNSAPVINARGEIEAGVSVFFDISTRKQSEQINRFLANLGERLLELYDPAEIKGYASQALGEFLGVDRCVLDEIDLEHKEVTIEADYSSDLPSIAGRYPINDHYTKIGKKLATGRFLVTDDAAAEPGLESVYLEFLRPLNMRSFVAIPRMKESKWRATMTVSSSQPRLWQIEEIGLLRSASDLIWLALEGANLMKSYSELSERFNVALKNAPVSVYMLDRNLRFTWVYNPPFNFTEEEMLGKRDDELHPISAISELIELKQQVLETGIGTRKELPLKLQGQEGFYDITIEPLHNIEGELVGLTVAWINITGQRRLEAEMRERAAQIEIQHQILRHRELERMEIARDLHDGPLQEMIGMNFTINELTMVDDPDERLGMLNQIYENLQQQIQSMRNFCYELRPPALTPFGLERAIRSHVENQASSENGLEFHLDLAYDGQALPEEIRLALFRVYQEALNNILRHAQASQVWVRFSFDDENIELEIRDNGQGFQVPFRWLDLAREGHLGLVGMHERVQAIDGQVFIESEPEKGTRIRVTVPQQRL